MHLAPETKKNHVWRKTIWHTDHDQHPLGPHHFAEIYCCEETNGYTIWYVRRLSKEDGMGNPNVGNADYLLAYFSKDNRDAAIERSVLISNSSESAGEIIGALDELAGSAQKI